MSKRAQVGVVAIGRNEGERLRRCIRSVSPEVPLVYVDSGSSDDSVSFALGSGREVVQLGPRTKFTAALARNAGLHRLIETTPRIEFVQFVDGDCEIENGWLEFAERFLSAHPDVAAVCGRRRERFRDSSFYNRLCDDEWNTPVGTSLACGGDVMLRVDALQQVGGYDATLAAGEEPELCARLRAAGWKIWRADFPMTIHDAAMHQFGQWWMRAVRSGFGYAQVWHKTLGRDHTLYGRELARAVFWSVGVLVMGLIASVIIGPAGLALIPACWLAQTLRLSKRHGARKGLFLLLSKGAEFAGALRYAGRLLRNRSGGTIFYK